MNYTSDKKTVLTLYLVFYYAVFLSFFIDHRLLSQYQPIFFNYNRDLTELALIASGIPKWMISHPASFLGADAIALLLPIALLGFYFRKGRFSWVWGVLFSCYLGCYLLLADLFWQVHLEPFILYLLLSFAFWTNREARFYNMVLACRYYFLYMFVSAALWKISRGAVLNGEEMSRILLLHHTDLLSGACDSLSCRTYLYLIAHPGLSWWLYLAGVLLEFSFITGFFTRRCDRLLLLFAVLFVIADMLLMRIPYWTILIGGATLWIGRKRSFAARKIAIYETTHHENLPALLDLSETHFSQSAVFLKRRSYENISGKIDPGLRWPKTEFIIQDEDCSNRAFIRNLFSFLTTQRVSHLHLATLDNNLLFFALRLWLRDDVHVSLTVHEVNEYFAYSFSSFRLLTESFAKLLLHRRIRHHTFFLPAMAQRFQQRLPGTVTAFIPSRFYQSPPPAGDSPASSDLPLPPGRPASAGITTPPTPFRVVVPGSIDPNRRDYEQVVQFFTHWLARPATSHRPVELTLLGNSDSVYAAGIIRHLERLVSPQFRVISYQGYVPELVYEQRIETADLLWSPLNVNKKSSRNSPETYGQTTASGLTADLLLNNAPALTPAGFLLPAPFRTALLTYASPAELQEIFERLLHHPAQAKTLRQQIHTAFSFYVKENFDNAFRSLTGLASSSQETQKTVTGSHKAST